MSDLPEGAVTMFFADIEGSTPLVHRLEDAYGAVLGDYRRLLRRAVAESGGHEVDCRADELFAVFEQAQDGVEAAVAAQRMLAEHAWPKDVSVKVRMGLHTGTPALENKAYLGVDVHRAIRICAAGHGGQILLSKSTRELVEDHFQARDLGSYALAGMPEPERIFQLAAAGLRTEFPPLRADRTDGRRLAGLRWRSRQPTFAEAAWHVRGLLPGVEESLQPLLAEVGGGLFTADRALRGADGFLERVDSDQLERRLDAQRRMAVLSPRARQQADRLLTRIACVERLADRRQGLASQATDLVARLDALRSEREITRLRDQLIAAIDELDQALTAAARALDPLSFRLGRTRHRGIYRYGRKYAVLFTDEAGTEHLAEFDILREARDFRTVKRIAEKRRHAVTFPPFNDYAPATRIEGDPRNPKH